LTSFDWFHICGDDTFVVVPNLRAFAATKAAEQSSDHGIHQVEKPLYLGAPFYVEWHRFRLKMWLCAGGQGYTLNGAALRNLVNASLSLQEPWLAEGSQEDFLIGIVFARMGVRCADTRDSAGAWRYPMDARLGEAGRKWPISPTTLSNAGMPSKTGIDAVSAETVSFHLKTFGSVKEISRALLRYHSVLNGDCDPQPAREVERVTESRGVTAITTPQRCRSLPVAPHQFRVADRPHRLLLLSTPKAGATITTQMMFSFLNLSMAALNYSRWIHDFRQRVFEKQGDHLPADPCVCGQDGWLCVHVVRAPLQRAVSSYLYAMRQRGWIWSRRRPLPEMSFAEWLDRLSVLQQGHLRPLPQHDHFLLQQPKQVACRQKVLYVPTEALPAALDELPQLVAFRNAHTPSSPHYVQTMSSNGVPMRQGAYGDTASWSWSRVKAAMDGHSLPPYESFFANQSLLQYALGCLYRPDVELYQAMCEQPELQGCVSCRRACTAFMQSMSQLSNRDHT